MAHDGGSTVTARPSSPTTPSSGSRSHTRSRGCSSSARRRRMAGRFNRSRALQTPSTSFPCARRSTIGTTTPARASLWLEQSLGTWHGAQGQLYDLKRHDTFVRTYLATLLSVDESVGRIVEALRGSGQLDDTAIVFTSDNGFVLGEHGRVDKRTMYEESIRVPLLVRYPRLVKAGTVVSRMVISHDLAPTLVALGGGEPLADVTGRSFLPLLRGQRTDWRTAFLYEYNYEVQFPYTP